MKCFNPIEVAEFACSNGIQNEPAFKWWVPYTMRRRDILVSSDNLRVTKISHKYGIEIPRKFAEVYALNAKHGNVLWRDAINREMENLKEAFEATYSWVFQIKWPCYI